MVDNGFDENFDEDFLGIGDDWNNTFQEEVGYTSKFDCQLNAINSLAIDQSEYLTSNDKNDFSQVIETDGSFVQPQFSSSARHEDVRCNEVNEQIVTLDEVQNQQYLNSAMNSMSLSSTITKQSELSTIATQSFSFGFTAENSGESVLPSVTEPSSLEELIPSIIDEDIDFENDIFNEDPFYFKYIGDDGITSTNMGFSALDHLTSQGLSPVCTNIIRTPLLESDTGADLNNFWHSFEGIHDEIDCSENSDNETLETSLINPQSKDLPCLVCGGNAGKHVHYGGQACYSCKAFFRRAVKDDCYKKFICTTSTKSCAIDSKSWKSCRACRYEKCLASGLKPNWVLDKKERKRRREKKKIQPEKTNDNQQFQLVNPVSKANPMIWSFTNDELMQIVVMGRQMHLDLTKSLTKFYGRNPTLFGQITSAIYHETLVPYELYMKWETIWPNTAKDLVTKSSGLDRLPIQDREKLTKFNFPALQIFLQSVLMINTQDFRSSNMGETMQGSLLKQSLDENSESDVERLHHVLRSLNIGMQMPPNALTYTQVFSSPWASRKDFEERHAYIMPKLGLWPVDKTDPKFRVDKAQLFLLYNIMMLSADGVTLEDESKASRLLQCQHNMLYRYLMFKYKDEAMALFSDGLELVKLGREAHEIRNFRLPV